MLDSRLIPLAYHNIKDHLFKTPLIESRALNEMLGHRIIFKVESFQHTGSFKVRGCFNSFIELRKKNNLPKKVSAYSTGNHGIGLAYVAKRFGVEVDLYLPSFTSKIKQKIAQKYGANIIYTKTRKEAETLSQEAANNSDKTLYIPPSGLDSVTLGAGTTLHESLIEVQDFDATFVPVGGGGLASGSYLARKYHNSTTKLFLAEPKQANDVAISLRENKIFRFSNSPETLADGAKTLGISSDTFEYVKKFDGIFEITEREIVYWTAWFFHLTKIVCEPTSALALAAANRWLKKEKKNKKMLVIITGGNLDSVTYHKIWAEDQLLVSPNNFAFDEE